MWADHTLWKWKQATEHNRALWHGNAYCTVASDEFSIQDISQRIEASANTIDTINIQSNVIWNLPIYNTFYDFKMYIDYLTKFNTKLVNELLQ